MITVAAPLPYPGLRAFERDESHLFFGRDKDIDALIDRLADTRFLAVTGASGSGKSSLVRTGLLAALDLGHFARAGSNWHIAECHPGGSPFLNLAHGLNESLEEDHRLPDAILRELLAQGPLSLAEWYAAQDWPSSTNLLVLVDQFEELFRYSDYAAHEEAEAFASLLIESARATHVPVHIVITMRSEFLGACALLPGLTEEINNGLYLTPRMARAECREAIMGPSRRMGFTVDEDLVNQILNDLAMFAPWEQDLTGAQGQLLSRRADQLPLMQHLLNRLWLQAENDENGRKRLTLAGYRRIGGLEGALDAHGEQVLERLSDADRSLVEPLFRTLVSGPDPSTAVRRPARFDELVGIAGGDTGATQRVVDAFRSPDCNFLRPDTSQPVADDTLIDIGHESLIRQWSLLNQWTQTEARSEANWARLVQAQQLHAAGEGDLLSGLNFDTLASWWDAQKPDDIWARRHGGGFAETEAFFNESRDQRKKRQAEENRKRLWAWRRLQATVAVMAVLVVIAGWAWLRALQGESEARIAELAAVTAREQAEAAQAAAEEALQKEQAERIGRQTAETRSQAAEVRLQSMQADYERRRGELAALERQVEQRSAEANRNLETATRALSFLNSSALRRNGRAVLEHCLENRDEVACQVLENGAPSAGNVPRN